MGLVTNLIIVVKAYYNITPYNNKNWMALKFKISFFFFSRDNIVDYYNN